MCFWILFYNASGHSCFIFFFFLYKLDMFFSLTFFLDLVLDVSSHSCFRFLFFLYKLDVFFSLTFFFLLLSYSVQLQHSED